MTVRFRLAHLTDQVQRALGVGAELTSRADIGSGGFILRRGSKPTSHRHWHFKSQRVGHSQFACAKDDWRASHCYQELDANYRLCLRHKYRRCREHLITFPAFDDDEHRTSWHSTGWKHSTKYRHQWEVRVRKAS